MADESPPDARQLNRWEYRRLLDAAGTYRETVVCRLAGEVGLRPAEMTRLVPADLTEARTDPSRYLLAVSGDRERTAYVPPSVAREIERYANSGGIDGDDPLLQVSPRRVQMLIGEVAARAAVRTGDESFERVSSRDLRRFFAKTLLCEIGVDPRTVKAVGGWRSLDSLDASLPEPTPETTIRAFDRQPEVVGGPRVSVGSPPGDGALATAIGDSEHTTALVTDGRGTVRRCVGSRPTLGYAPEELFGRSLSTLTRNGGPIAPGDGSTDGRWLRRKDGSDVYARIEVAHARDGERTLLLTDLSEERRRHDALRTDRDRLRRRVELSERIQSIGAALFEAGDREAIETEVCEGLSAEYEYAWIVGRSLSTSRPEPTAVAGIDSDGPSSVTDALSGTYAAVLGEVETRLADGIGDGDRVLVAPVASGETVQGTLCVASRHAFEPWERDRLELLGRLLSAALATHRRRTLALSDVVVELELECTDERSFLVSLSRVLDCDVRLRSVVPVEESSLLAYAVVTDAAPAEVVSHAVESRGVTDQRLVDQRADESLLEFTFAGESPALTLTEYGASVQKVAVSEGRMRIVADCARDTDVRVLVDGLSLHFPDSSFVGKREVERTDRTAGEFGSRVTDRLTDRQATSLEAAYFGGYFDWPRGSTAEEVADAMGITSPTLHNHLRKGQRTLLEAVFEREGLDS
ncbi:bacterio-opsin activator domain-containing protein [Natronorarus salvus]|uniref:bacterio-opsin activator domain-containing protein n=1 Tax=Natronorarus salvus TaxID=3117733 RepID=UPI002F262180